MTNSLKIFLFSSIADPFHRPLPDVANCHGTWQFGLQVGSEHALAQVGFAFFPPTPTITDAAHDEQFQITLVSNATRDLAATITRTSTGAPLATATIDQSGTGTNAYSDGSTAAVTSWTLAD
jgi:hypothetical protein